MKKPPIHGSKEKPKRTVFRLIGRSVENINGQTVSGHLTDEVRHLIRNRMFTNLKTVQEKGFHRLKGIEFHDMKVVQFIRKVGNSFQFMDMHEDIVVTAEVKDER